MLGPYRIFTMTTIRGSKVMGFGIFSSAETQTLAQTLLRFESVNLKPKTKPLP
jgi:hypothetical protein